MHGLLSERCLWNREWFRESRMLYSTVWKYTRFVQSEHLRKIWSQRIVVWSKLQENSTQVCSVEKPGGKAHISQNILNNWKLLPQFLKRHMLSNCKECASCYTSLQESFLQIALSYLMSLRKGWRPSSMTAMKESPQPGNSISAPVHTTVEGIKDEWSNMIRTGELSVGAECTPHTITKYSTAGGDLTAKTTTVYGRKVPMLDLSRSYSRSTRSTCICTPTNNWLVWMVRH